MIKCSEKVFSKLFSDETSKGAYLKACKWLANNIVGKDEFEGFLYEIVKEKEEIEQPTFRLTLFVAADLSVLEDKHCAVCKEMHNKTFCNDNCNCSWCNMKGFASRTKDFFRLKRKYYNERLR